MGSTKDVLKTSLIEHCVFGMTPVVSDGNAKDVLKTSVI